MLCLESVSARWSHGTMMPPAHNPRSDDPPRLDVVSASSLAKALFRPPDSDKPPFPHSFPTIPGYQIEGVLGEGAASIVYLARDEAARLAVAIKVLRPPTGGPGNSWSRFAERAWREIQVLSDMDLRCLPRVRAQGCLDSPDRSIYVVTDCVEGRTLEAHCAALDLNLDQRVGILADVCDAVQTIHECGVIHRDLKPSNIILTPDGEPKVIDFGLAVLAREGIDPLSTLTQEGAIVGTPAFMAPEQARGERTGSAGRGGSVKSPVAGVTVRTDVYALGAIGYVLLTGSTPHDLTDDLPETVRRIAQDQPRDPRTLNANVPAPLAAVLQRACALDARDRYSSARELADDLRRWLRREPVSAVRPSAWTKVLLAARRHPRRAAASLAFASLCLIATTATIASSVAISWYLNSRPDRIELTQDNKTAILRSGLNRELTRWNANSFAIADIRNRPKHLGGGRVIVISADNCPQFGSRSHELLLLDASDPDRILWSSGRAGGAFVAPGLEEQDDDDFRVRACMLADVFDEPPGAEPADEIIVIHGHHSWARSAISVYDLAGNLRFRAWHWGQLTSLWWSEPTGLIAACGVSNVHAFKRLGIEGLQGLYPHAVVGLAPSDGLLDGWLCRPLSMPDAQTAESLRFHRLVWPPETADALPTSRLDQPKHGGTRNAVATLTLKGASGAALYAPTIQITIDLTGSMMGDPIVNDALRRSDPTIAQREYRLIDSASIPIKTTD